MLTDDGPRPARVQRPLRRPRDAGHPAAARRRARAAAARRGPRRLAGAARPLGLADARLPRCPGAAVGDRPRGRRLSRTRRAAATRSTGLDAARDGRRARLPRRHRAATPDGALRDGRRPRPDGRRARAGPRRPRATPPSAPPTRSRFDGHAAPPRHRRATRRSPRPRSGPPDDPPLHARRDGRDLDRRRPGSRRCSGSSSRSPRAQAARGLVPAEALAAHRGARRASTSSGSPRSSGRPTTTSSPSSARSPRRSGPRAATSTSG